MGRWQMKLLVLETRGMTHSVHAAPGLSIVLLLKRPRQPSKPHSFIYLTIYYLIIYRSQRSVLCAATASAYHSS